MDAALFERLRSWRGEQAKKQRVPAYVVLHNSHLEEISARKPGTIHELGAIKGVGLRRAARYGDEILAMIRGEEAPDSAPPAQNGYRAHLEAAAGCCVQDGAPTPCPSSPAPSSSAARRRGARWTNCWIDTGQ